MKNAFNRFFSALALTCLAISCGEEPIDPKGDEGYDLNVKCTTGEATEIEFSSAKLSAAVTIENAKAANGKASFYYSMQKGDAETLKAGTKVDAGSVAATGGSFTAALEGLTPETEYYYVAVVIIDDKEFFGEVKSFITKEIPKEPAITGEASDITEISAVLSGSVNPTADMQDVLIGIFYSTESSPNIENSVKVKATEIKDNVFHVSLDGLSSNTTYYYKTYLQYNGEQYRFGDIKSFTTLEVKASVETTGVTDVTEFKATLNGKLNLDAEAQLVKEVWFLYGKYDSLEELQANGMWKPADSLSEDGSFSGSIEGLEYGAEYFFVAGAGVHDQQFYSEPAVFSTLSFNVSVTTLEATNITEFKATLNARLEVDCKEDLSKSVWFLYGKDDSLDSLLANGTVAYSSLSEDGSFAASLDYLEYGVEYHYVAAASVYDQIFYSEPATFNTLSFNVSVTTLDATEITERKAILNAKLEVDSKEDLYKSVWFLYGKDDSLDGLLANGTRAYSSLSEDSSFAASLDNLDFGVEYHYVAAANVVDKECFGDVLSFVSWDYTYIGESIDLGLSVQWSSMNLGATSPEEYGAYFAWGEIERKPYYDWSTYKWCNGSCTSLTKYNIDNSKGEVDNKTQLEAEDDVAHVKLGGNFRMPTRAEFEELINNCEIEWTSINGVRGSKFTSKKTGYTDKWIFLPAAGSQYDSSLRSAEHYGIYWSSSLNKDNPCLAWYLTFNWSRAYTTRSSRDIGNPVRPVSE